MAVLPGLRVGLTLDSDSFDRGIRRVEGSLNNLNRSIGATTLAIKTATAAFGGLIAGFSVSALVEAGKRAVDMAGGLKEVAQQAGITAGELQTLAFIGTQVGLSQEQIVAGFRQFNRRVGEAAGGAGTLGKLFKTLDIEVKNASGSMRSSFDILGDVAEAVKNANSQQEKFVIAQQSLGRVGALLLPLLNEGRVGIQRYADQVRDAGLIIEDAFIDKADQASDTLSGLQFAIQQGFQIGVVQGFNAELELTTENLRQARDAGQQLGTLVGKAMAGILDILNRIAPILKVITDTFASMNKQGEEFLNILRNFGVLGATVESLNEQIGEANENMARLAAERKKLAQEGGISTFKDPMSGQETTVTVADINNQFNAVRANRDALIAQREELKKSASAQTALGSAMGDTTEAADDQISALDSLGKSAKAAEDPIKRLTEALKDAKIDTALIGADEATKKLAASLKSAGVEFEVFDKRVHTRGAAFPLANQLLKEFEAQDAPAREAKAKKAIEDRFKAEQAMRARARQQTQREEDQFAEQLKGLYQGVGQSIQGTFADTYEQIFRGGITSFSDLASSIKDIFIRLAAEIAALMTIRPVLSGLSGAAGGLAGGAGSLTAAQQAAGVTIGGAGGFASMFGRFPGFGNLAGASAPRIGANGMLTGGQLQSQLGASAPAAGFLGAPSGASLGGLLISGALGAVGGNLLGGFFGGQGRIGGSIGGGLGATAGTFFGGPIGGLVGGIGGSLVGGALGSLFGKKTQSNNVSIQGALGAGAGGTGAAAQFVTGIDDAISNVLSSTQEAIVNQALSVAQAVRVKYSKQLSANDEASLARGRFGPAAQALGLNASAVTAGSAQQQQRQFGEAVNALQEIQKIQAGPLGGTLKDINDRFVELTVAAQKYGISLAGVGEEWSRQQREVIENWRIGAHATMVAVGAIRDVDQALGDLDAQMNLARIEAERLGISTANSYRLQALAAETLIQQWRLNMHGVMESVGVITTFERQWGDLDAQMRLLSAEAQRLGVSTDQLGRVWAEAQQQLARQQQATLDAMALSITDPFSRLIEPLRRLGIELDRSMMNPLEQFNAAAQNFRDVATQAAAGSTTAIQQLDQAGRDFISTATAVGASPAAAKATEEVRNVLTSVQGQIAQAQAQAQRGIENAVTQAGQRVVDTLRELVVVGQQQVAEMRKLQRNLT